MNNGKTLLFIFLALITQQTWIIIESIISTYFTSSIYFNSITHLNGVLNGVLDLLLTRVFFSYIFYFIIGIHVCQNYEDVLNKIFNAKKWIIPTIIVFTGIISALWVNGIAKYGSYDNIPQSYSIYYALLNSIYYPFIFFMFLIISLNCFKNKNKYFDCSKKISLLGRYSFGIYLIHPFYMIMITTLIFPHFSVDFNQLIFYPTLFILTLLLSSVSVYLISYLPYSEILIGINKTKISKYY
jgi:membrane-bound acyltransferase YfiQ involved in biofilm formation